MEDLPFLVPLAVALGMVVIEVLTGGLSDLLPSVDFGVGEVDADLDAGMGAGTAPVWLQGLGWLGFGKAPITVLLEVMGSSFGVAGLWITAAVHDMLPMLADYSLAVALPVAAVVSVVATRFVGEGVHQVIQASATTAPVRGQFVGQQAVVMSRLTPTVGEVKIVGEHQPYFLNARVAEGVIEQGTEVVLVAYDAEKNIYTATRLL